MPHTPKHLLPLLFLLALLAGCHSEPTSFLPEESAKYSLENTEKFQLLDRTAQVAVACTGLQEHFNDAGRLEVVANLRNRGRAPIAMQVRCVFQDAAGLPTGDETPWLPLNLDAGDTEAVHYFAVNSLERKFTIMVRSRP
jgi:hypothetical protein